MTTYRIDWKWKLIIVSFIIAALYFCIDFVFMNSPHAAGQPRSNYYTAEKRQAVQDNVKMYKWARDERDASIRRAQKYIDLSYEELWSMITTQALPRSYDVNEELGSVIGGQKGPRDDRSSYEIDPVAKPWKVKDKSNGMMFPTNDFASYYRSGLDDKGGFDPKRADRKYLVNTLYPDKGTAFGVDDGSGYVDEKGNKYTFIAFYNHWVWSQWLTDALRSLREAYLYTGNEKYAFSGLILLDRVADVYPDMDVSVYRWEDGFKNAHGGTGQGKVLGSIAEVTLTEQLLLSYDAFLPVLQKKTAPYLSFLQKKAARYSLPSSKGTADSIKQNFENRIIRQIVPAVKKAQISGNFGSHQNVIALAAITLDQLPESAEWIQFALQSGQLERVAGGGWRISGGGVYDVLANRIDRDGYGDEASPEYNVTWLERMNSLADILDSYERVPSADLYKHPKVKKMFYAFLDLVMQGKDTPNIGDSGSIGKDNIWAKRDLVWRAFVKYRDPLFAQAAFLLNGNRTEGITNDLFQPKMEALLAQFRKVVQSQGSYKFKSINLTGYGYTALRHGDIEAWLYYGRNGTSHAHRDALNIGLYGFGLDMAPDLGYVTFADDNILRRRWESNTISHNTVVFNKEGQQPNSWVGIPRHYDDGKYAKLIDVEAPYAYEGADMYRRTFALIPIDDRLAYAVDFFRVNGAGEQVSSFHGMEGTVETGGLKLVEQKSGTYAGEQIPLADPAYSEQSKSGYNYLYNVRKDKDPIGQFYAEWKSTKSVSYNRTQVKPNLRVTMLGSYSDAAVAQGDPPQNKPGNPRRLDYLLTRRPGGESLFTSILEPFAKERTIKTIRRLSVTHKGAAVPEWEAIAIEVALQNGRKDTIICSLESNREYQLENGLSFKGFFGLTSMSSKGAKVQYAHDGTWLQNDGSKQESKSEAERLVGKIAGFTTGWSLDNRLELQFENMASFDVKKLVGTTVYVDNHSVTPSNSAAVRNAAYTIKSVIKQEGSHVVVSLGNTTFIQQQIGDRFIYDIQAGQSFVIPLSQVRQF